MSKLEISLPKIISDKPLIHQISSFSFSGEIYKVNITDYSCSCYNWQQERILFEPPDIRRACKHISSLLNILPYHWILPVPSSNYYRLSTFEIDKYTYVLVQQESYWIDIKVLNPKKEVYEYGYNFDEKRWAHQLSPRHSKYVRPLIFSWFKGDSPDLWKVEF